MGWLWEAFNDVLDIVTAPVKIATKVTDAVLTMWEEEPLTNIVDNIKDSVKIKR